MGLTNLQSGTWTEAEEQPDSTECVLDWELCAGEGADSQWGWWRAEDDGWSPSGERTTEHTCPVVAPAGHHSGRGTGGQEDPSAEEVPQMSASWHHPAALSKQAVRGSVEEGPGAPDRTAGRTGGKVKPPAGVLLPRLQLRSWGRPGRHGALDAVPPPDLWLWGICPG